jgi:hypothetical protein
MTIDPDRIYVVSEVAKILRCSPANVYNLLSSGALAHIPIGADKKGFRVQGRDVIAFIHSRREGAPGRKGRSTICRESAAALNRCFPRNSWPNGTSGILSSSNARENPFLAETHTPTEGPPAQHFAAAECSHHKPEEGEHRRLGRLTHGPRRRGRGGARSDGVSKCSCCPPASVTSHA